MKTEDLYQVYLQHPSVSIDSRSVKEGDIFFALKGPNFDGNQYAVKALGDGAAYAVVDNPDLASLDNTVCVNDVLEALQKLAAFHRLRLRCPVIAITGSNGKSTTKELLLKVLSKKFRTVATRGNLNNHIGVPLTLLSIPLATEMSIIEMGANHTGEIAELCVIARPSHGVITSIGKAHLEGFGSMAAIVEGKGELIDSLNNEEGVFFFNRDIDQLNSKVQLFKGKLIQFGLHSDGADFSFQFDCAEPNVYISYGNGKIIKSQLPGKHHAHNIMAAATIGMEMGVPFRDVSEAIEGYTPSSNRSEIKTIGRITFILDAYNANPTSMSAALEMFSLFSDKGKKIVVLGDMKEMGTDSLKEHEAMMEMAQGMTFDGLYFIGSQFMEVSKQKDYRSFEDVHEFSRKVDLTKWGDAIVLLKGSRSIGLEKIYTFVREFS